MHIDMTAPYEAELRPATKRVLVVEDNEALRTLLAEYLEEAGYVVDVAVDGQPALACMHAAVPDVVILDLGLPVVDGRTLVALCRQDPRLAAVPMVLLSASTDLHLAVEETDARGGLAKPVDLDVLLAIVECVSNS
jgi:CheY-like chemotaxis protein